MNKIEMYTKVYCPYCDKAKRILHSKNQTVIEYNIELNPEYLKEMLERTNHAKTVPQIFINGVYVGPCDNLEKLEKEGELDKMLQS